LEFRQLYGVPRAVDDNYAGDVGNAIHRGYGAWLATEDETEAILSFGMAFPYEQEFLKAGQSSRSMEAAFGSLLALMHSGFLQQYQVVKINTLDQGVRYGVEIPFAFHITNAPMAVPVYFVGFIDCVLYDNHRDRYIVTDLKTTRQKLDDPTAKFQFDQQTIPYGIILEHILGRTIEEIEVAYLYDYIDLLQPKVRLLEYRRTLDDVMDWKRGLCETVERIAGYYNSGWFPRAVNGDSCIAYNRACEFHDVCSYRNTGVLNKIIAGEARKELFTTGEKPWIIAELPFERFGA
jgi:hypothetical protein